MFIQLAQGECTREDDMRALVDDWCARMAHQPGWLGGTYGFTDDHCFIGVVRYADREAWDRWCKDPDAASYWAAAEALFDEDCTVHESDDVLMLLDGGSDDAGFVQVLHGRIGDDAKLHQMFTDTEMTTMLHEARPEIIGATMAFHPDGTFTETVAFTDEAAARRGESQEMPQAATERFTAAIGAVEYSDLHRPWFAHHE